MEGARLDIKMKYIRHNTKFGGGCCEDGTGVSGVNGPTQPLFQCKQKNTDPLNSPGKDHEASPQVQLSTNQIEHYMESRSKSKTNILPSKPAVIVTHTSSTSPELRILARLSATLSQIGSFRSPLSCPDI